MSNNMMACAYQVHENDLPDILVKMIISSTCDFLYEIWRDRLYLDETLPR